MKASEARRLTQEKNVPFVEEYLKNAYKEIEVAANQGISRIVIASPKIDIIGVVVKTLEDDGYIVYRYNRSDLWDGKSYDFLTISWQSKEIKFKFKEI